MDYVFTIYSFLFFTTSVVSFFVSYLAWQRKHSKSAHELKYLMLIAGFWAVISMFESAATAEHTKIFWSKIEYIIAPSVPVLYLVFVLSFTRKEKYITVRNILLLLIIPIISTILAFTNEMHHLIWTGFSPISTSTNLLHYSHGWWFWLGYTGYGYIIFLISTFILYYFIIQFSKLFKWQALAIFIGGLFPWAASILYIIELNPVPGLNITPFSIIASGATMAIVILYSRLLSLAPIARDLLVENLDDGILVLDDHKRIQDINQSAMDFLGIHSKNIIGLPLEFTDASVSQLYNHIIEKHSIEKVCVQVNGKAMWFSIFIHILKRKPESKLIVIRDITSHVRMEQELANSEEYHRTLVRSIPDMLFVLSNNGVIVDFKADVSDLYTTPELFMGKNFSEVLPPNIVALMDNAIQKTLSSGDIAEINYELQLSGQVKFYHARIIAFSNDKLVCIVRDTTQRTLAEKYLRESEENFRSFFETIDDVIIIGTSDGAVLFANPSVKRKLGYSFDELKAMGMMGVVPSQMINEALLGFKEILDGRRNICTLPLQRKDGSLMPVETRFWMGTWNKQPCVFRISKDLSKEQEALLKFNKLFDNNPALMAVTKLPMNRFVDINKAFISISGYSKEEIIGKTAEELGLFVEIKELEDAKKQFLSTGRLDNFDIQIRKKNGDVINGLFSGEKIESNGEKMLLTVMTDISKQKEAETNLLLAKQAADIANKAKSEFLANMSHEIRTPMNSILGFSEIMLNSTEDPKHREFLNTILSSGNTLLSLINDILDLSKVEAGRMEINPEYTTIKTIITEIKQLFDLKARQKHIDLRINYDPEMPKTVLIDEVRLRQILLNIVGNAVKFTNNGYVSVDVTLLNKKDDVIYFEIGVVDSGIGIPPQDMEKIFDAFSQQSGHDNRIYGGTGLGLAICKRLVELMGGEIKVESKVGRGSRFILYFNNVPFVAEAVSKEKSFVWDINELVFEPAKILIVDDVEHNRFLVKAYLSRYNFELFEAENGKVAIEMIRKNRPNLVFMDIRMPVLDGFEATKIIKADPDISKTPIVALTASTLQNEVEDIKYIFDGFLLKPVKKTEIIHEIKKYIPYKLLFDETTVEEENALSNPKVKMKNEIVFDSVIKEQFVELYAAEIAEQKLFMLFDNLSDLCVRLTQFASDNKIQALYILTKELKEFVDAFDFEKIQNCLTEIEELFCL